MKLGLIFMTIVLPLLGTAVPGTTLKVPLQAQAQKTFISVNDYEYSFNNWIYLMPISISGIDYYVQIDFGTSWLIVSSDICALYSIYKPPFCIAGHSKTISVTLGNEVLVGYQTSTSIVMQPRAHIANQTVLMVNPGNLSTPYGLLGLYRDQGRITDESQSVLDHLYLHDYSFTMSFSLFLDPVEDSSYLLFGGFDLTQTIDHEMTFTPLLVGPGPPGFIVRAEAITIGKGDFRLEQNFMIRFDPRQSNILVSPSLFAKISDALMKDSAAQCDIANEEEGIQRGYVLCRLNNVLLKASDIGFRIGGSTFSITSFDYLDGCQRDMGSILCIALISVSNKLDNDTIVLGTPFIRKHYLHVDLEKQILGISVAESQSQRIFGFVKGIAGLILVVIVTIRIVIMADTGVFQLLYRHSHFLKRRAAAVRIFAFVVTIISGFALFPL